MLEVKGEGLEVERRRGCGWGGAKREGGLHTRHEIKADKIINVNQTHQNAVDFSCLFQETALRLFLLSLPRAVPCMPQSKDMISTKTT